MKSRFKWAAVLTAALLCGAVQAQAPAQNTTTFKVMDFDASTWAQLMKTGPRPAAYLFTTSYCSTCPEAFEKIHAHVTAKHQPIPLMAVMMDVSGDQALRHAMHFQGMTQMYAFNGFEPEIRQSVDPQWPNITPYVVLIGKTGKVQRFIGPPTPAALRAWLG